MRWYFIGVVILFTACTKDFNLKLNNTQPLYVIEGRISNLQGPYFVRITKSTSLFGYPTTNNGDSVEAVQNAQVIITDDMGTADTLIPVVDHLPRWYYYYNNGQIDSLYYAYRSLSISYGRGYYQTTKIKGVPGHTYQLHVQVGDSTFQASAYMPHVPTPDSVTIQQNAVVNPSGDVGSLPLVWFKEPQDEKNYYMLQFYPHINEYPYDAFWMDYNNYYGIPYVLDDKILPPYVKGLSIEFIVSDNYSYGSNWIYGNFYPNKPSHIRLCSLTKEAYNYFSELRKQLQTDGNAYRAVPASASGNISGGALGLFWASDISYKLILP
jgi:Domain of unknown function (DUF4249)